MMVVNWSDYCMVHTVLCKLIGTPVNHDILSIFNWWYPCSKSKYILFLKNDINFCNLFRPGVYVEVTLFINI